MSSKGKKKKQILEPSKPDEDLDAATLPMEIKGSFESTQSIVTFVENDEESNDGGEYQTPTSPSRQDSPEHETYHFDTDEQSDDSPELGAEEDKVTNARNKQKSNAMPNAAKPHKEHAILEQSTSKSKGHDAELPKPIASNLSTTLSSATLQPTNNITSLDFHEPGEISPSQSPKKWEEKNEKEEHGSASQGPLSKYDENRAPEAPSIETSQSEVKPQTNVPDKGNKTIYKSASECNEDVPKKTKQKSKQSTSDNQLSHQIDNKAITPKKKKAKKKVHPD